MALAQAVARDDYNQLDSPPLMELCEEHLDELVDQMQAYHAIYRRYFSHEAQQTHSYTYLLGLLNPEIKRKYWVGNCRARRCAPHSTLSGPESLLL